MDTFRLVFFHFRPESSYYHFHSIRSATHHPFFASSICVSVPFEQRIFVLRLISFLQRRATIVRVIIAVDGSEVRAAPIFNRRDTSFANSFRATALPHRLRSTSKQERRAIFVRGHVPVVKLKKCWTGAFRVGAKVFIQSKPCQFSLFRISRWGDLLNGTREQGYRFKECLPQFVRGRRVSHVVRQHVPLPVIHAGRMFQREVRDQGGGERRANRALRPFNMVLSTAYLPLFVTSNRTTSRLNFPIVSNVPRRGVTMASVRPRHRVFHVEGNVMFQVNGRLIVTYLGVFHLLPTTCRVFVT